jgi:hypothetical protein
MTELPVQIHKELDSWHLTDAWWTRAVLLGGDPEVLLAHWRVGIDSVGPRTLAERLPEDCEVLHRLTMVDVEEQTAAIRLDGALVFLDLAWANLWVRVAAPTLGAAEAAMARLRELFPQAERDDEEKVVPITLWHGASHHGPRPTHRDIDVAEWADVADNYPASPTREGLEALMKDFVPGRGGRLLLWHGPPGTGKTYALRALAWEWRRWCQVHYIMDPEALFAEPAYLMQVMAGMERRRHPASRDGSETEIWRLLVLEDTGEMLTPDAKSRVGQGLSRLLNLADGFIGQAVRVLVLVTSSEPVEGLHQAIGRPGRCAAEVEFRPMSAAEGRAWLESRAGGETFLPVEGSVTVAELYGVLEGGRVEQRRSVGFLP